VSNLSELIPAGSGGKTAEFVASGALPNGQSVILNANGTITAVTGSGSAQDIPAGSNVVYSSTTVNDQTIAFDPNTANKFAIAYQFDQGSTGRIVIGTVSGNSLSFGGAVTFSSSNVELVKVSFDPNTANKLAIAYVDVASSGAGTVIIGTVSGTSVSFGSKQVFNSGATSHIDMKFDPINSGGKFVVVYSDGGNSSYGTSRVGTVSGSSVSYGTEVVYNSSNTTEPSIAFDRNTSNKYVIGYRNLGNSQLGTAICGTISGTSSSYGSPVVFATGPSEKISIAFEKSVTGRFIIAFNNGVAGGDPVAKAVIGALSGSTISFGALVTIQAGNYAGNVIALACDDSVANRAIIGYTGDGISPKIGRIYPVTIDGNSITVDTPIVYANSETVQQRVSFDPNTAGKFVYIFNASNGTAFVGKMNSLSTNLTSTNLIGISAEAIASGATGKVNVLGGLNKGQSSLTPASIYYVQDNGTITTASASPAQKIGQAISSTKLNLVDL